MRVTYDSYARRYVWAIRAGTSPVRRIMYGDRQIWPSNEDRVRTAAVDMSALDGTLEGAYWLHALDAVKDKASESCFMKLHAGGRTLLLQNAYGTLARAVYSRGVIDFGDEGPLAEDLRPGSMIEVSAVVPRRRATVAYASVVPAEPVWELPRLPGSTLYFGSEKGRKRTCPTATFEWWGEPSHTLHLRAFWIRFGHRRGFWDMELACRAGTGAANGSVSAGYDRFVPGDRRSVVRISQIGGAGEPVRVCPTYPPFRMSWRLRVTAITTNAEATGGLDA